MYRKKYHYRYNQFFSIEYGDEVLVGGKKYIVKGHKRERRFGIEDPKFWVKLADESDTGEKKILKLTYFESFEITLADIKDLYERVEPGDLSIIDRSRFVNLQKLYPYVPKMLNDILMHFSRSAHVYYENMDEVIEDMNKCLYSVF